MSGENQVVEEELPAELLTSSERRSVLGPCRFAAAPPPPSPLFGERVCQLEPPPPARSGGDNAFDDFEDGDGDGVDSGDVKYSSGDPDQPARFRSCMDAALGIPGIGLRPPWGITL